MATPHAPTTERSQWPSTPTSNRSTGFQYEDIETEVIEIGNVQAGMINRLPRDQVPQGSGRLVVNARVRDDWVGRRPGTVSVGPMPPNAEPILAVVTFITEGGTVHICRVTATTFHVLNSSQTAWAEYEILDEDGDPAPLSGFPFRLDFAQFFDNLYMTDGATNRLWEVNFTAQRVQQVAGAPRGKFVTAFADRIIVANLRKFVGGIRPSSLAWSANANPRDWTHVSAGEEDLAATNIGDTISGIFGLENVMVILRKRSISIAERQPFAAAPFRFVSLINGIGCDLPYTAVEIPGGLIFADQRTREVYLYAPGNRPEPIAGHINRDLYEDLGRLEFAQGTYDPYEKEYHLGLTSSVQGHRINRVWVFSLEKGAWTLDNSPEVTTLGIVSLPGLSPTIDELIGTIDEQFPPPTGTINDYREPGGIRPTLFKGTAFGEILSQTYDSPHDSGATEEEFLFQFRSPNLGSLSRRRSLKGLELTTEFGGGGEYTLFHLLSEDEPLVPRNVKFEDYDVGRRLLRIPKAGITGNDLFWQLETNAPGFRLFSWWVRLLEKGVQRG